MADIFTGRLREEIPAALEALLPALQTCPALHTVNLCDNAFGPTAAAPLELFLETHVPLKHLYLQNNGMGPEAGARMARALSKNNKAALETLVCGRNRLENGSAAAWSACFTTHASTLTTVKMPQNGIRPEGIEQLLTHGLARCLALQTLDFQDNTFTLRGAEALVQTLPAWPQLTQLAIGDCLLSARGGVRLAQALEAGRSKNVKVLRLQYNDIDGAGVNALRVALERGGLPVLELLELNGNRFQEDDANVTAIRDLFEARGVGELDELDDLEEESDADEDEDEDDDDEADQEEADEVVGDRKHEQESGGAGAGITSTKPVSDLDAMIEKNLAQAISGLSTEEAK